MCRWVVSGLVELSLLKRPGDRERDTDNDTKSVWA